MDPSKIDLEQVFEGLAASGMRTILWDSHDSLVYADPGMHELYESKEFKASFGKVELSVGMSWTEWTKQEIQFGIIELPNDMTEEAYLKKQQGEREAIQEKRAREVTFNNGITILSTDVRLSSGGLFSTFLDITDQKRQQHELLKSNQKNEMLASAMDKSSSSMFVLDKDYRFVFANSKFISIAEKAGFEFTENGLWEDFFRLLVQSKWISTEGMSEDEFVQNRLDELKALKTSSVEERSTSSGDRVLTTSRLNDGGLVQIHTDVTDLKRMNKTVSLLSDAMNKSNNGIMITDDSDKVVFANKFVMERMEKAGISFTEQIQYSDHIRKFIDSGIVKLPKGTLPEEFIASRIKEREDIKDQHSRELDTEMGARIQTTTRLDDGGLVILQCKRFLTV